MKAAPAEATPPVASTPSSPPPLDNPPGALFDSRSPAERARSRGTWISLSSQVLAALLAYLLQIVLARSLGPSGFGAYATVLAWTGPLAVLASAGLPAAAVRLVSAFSAQRDQARFQGLLRASQRLVLAITIAIAAAGTALALLLLGATPARGVPVLGTAAPWIAGLWTLPPAVLLALRTEIARASGRYEAAFLVPLLQPVAMLAAALAMKRILGEITPALALVLPAFGALVVLVSQRAHRDLAPRPEAPITPIYETRAWLRVGLAVLAVDAAHLLLSQADALLVGAMRGAQAVALLGVAGATAGFAMFPMIAVGASHVPAFAACWALGDRAGLERLAQRAVRRAFAAQLAVALVLLAIARPVLALYGGDFTEARLPLLFALGGQLANTGTGYVGSIMTMTGHQNVVGRAIWPAAALNVALVIAGTHLFGVPGAAAGTALSSLGWNLWLHRLVVRHTGMRVSFVDAILTDLRWSWARVPALSSLPDRRSLE